MVNFVVWHAFSLTMPASAQQIAAIGRTRKRRTKRDRELDYLRSHIPLMKIMRELTPEQCESLIPFVKSSAHDALCSCIYNAIYNFRKLPQQDAENLKSALSSKIQNYKYLSEKRSPLTARQVRQREAILEQSGSGLPAILTAVLPLVASLFATQ